MANFHIGDSVSVLDEDLSGVVTRIGAEITIETPDGFQINFNPSDLVLESDKKIIANHSNPSPIYQKDIPQKPKKQVFTEKTKKKNIPAMEVDLHIHQLVRSEKGMSPYEMLNIQIDTVKRKLEFAFQKRIQKIVFIHGVGEGILRAELEYLLRQYDNLKFYDADYQKYGQGALEVYIFQNKNAN